uniref:Potassium channel domain-containing protein n=1 Tax=Clastoptera arizonana TaxID=38151 RepID=A0A1B6DH55_9HEMI
MERKRSSRRYVRRQKTWTQRCKDFIRQFVAFLFSNVGIIVLVIGYTIAGSFMFREIEHENYGKQLREISLQVERAMNRTAARLWQTTCCTENVFATDAWRLEVDKHLKEFQDYVVEEVQKNGYEGKRVTNRWTFSGAFLYSLSVITTIGYGNVAPRTSLGKLATIVYAIAGMPLFLLYLSNIGDILAKSFKWTYAKCFLCRSRYRQRRKRAIERSRNSVKNWQQENVMTEAEDSDDEFSEETSSVEEDPQAVTVPITLCLAIMVGYVYGGACLFSIHERWNLLDGSYFCFISLSTIGFGDIVPNDNAQIEGIGDVGTKFIFCSMYLMLGMALIAMCFNLMQEEVVHKIRTCGDIVRRVLRCRR